MRCKAVWIFAALVVLGCVGRGAEWAVQSQVSFSLQGIQGTPHSISPDGKTLLAASNEAGICLYRTEDLSPVGCFRPEGIEEPLWLRPPSIVWSPDGKHVLFSVMDGRLWRLDVDTGELEWLPASTGVEYVAFSPDGETLAVGGGGYIVVAPPGALAEAPVARYQGILKGLVWCEAGLYYGVLAPDRKTFQIWTVSPRGDSAPELLCSYPFAGLFLFSVSPDGRYAWMGAALVELNEGELLRVSGGHTLTSFAFSRDGANWLYSYQTVKDLAPWWVLAVRPAGTSEGDEQVLLEVGKRISILGWSPSGLVGLFLVHLTEPELLFLELALRR